MKKSVWTRFAALFAALLLALIVAATPAEAARRVTVKRGTFTTSTAGVNKRAIPVKSGVTNLTIKKGQGYLKFMAPATKTYTFTFSRVRSKYVGASFVEIQMRSKILPKFTFLEKLETRGGESDTLWLSVNGYKDKHNKGVKRCLASRTGQIKLTKGEEIFFYFYNNSAKTTARLVIK